MASVPRNIMCSKKWANPLFPASTSSREPVPITIWSETMSGSPVGTTTARSPLSKSRTATSNG